MGLVEKSLYFTKIINCGTGALAGHRRAVGKNQTVLPAPPTSHKRTSCQPWDRIGLYRGNSRIALLAGHQTDANLSRLTME